MMVSVQTWVSPSRVLSVTARELPLWYHSTGWIFSQALTRERMAISGNPNDVYCHQTESFIYVGY